MAVVSIAVVLLLLTAAGFYAGRRRAVAAVGGQRSALHSLPGYHGFYVALWCAIPGFLLFAGGLVLLPHLLRALTIANLPADLAGLPADKLGLVLAAGAAALAGLRQGHKQVAPELRARNRVERTVSILLIILSTISVLTTVGIVMSLLLESLRFFGRISIVEFLFGLQWSPQMAIRADQVGSSGAFGAVPLFTGTLLITGIAMLVAVPTGLMSAVYMADYASPRLRAIAKPVLEVLAGIPTVVYGFFAALTVAPAIRAAGEALGLEVAAGSALAAG